MSKIKLDLYKKIFKIRQTEKKISELYNQNEMRCPVHLSIGQEGVAAGVCHALKNKDSIISTHRSHSHYIAKEGDLKKMISEIYSKKSGCAMGLGGSMHLQDNKQGIISSVPIVASTIPIGVGLAYYNKHFEKKNNIVVIFFGEGATEEGVFHESINFASLHSLPILFVCENNLYSVYTPIELRQAKTRNLQSIVKANGIKSYITEGNDVMSVFKLAKKAIENIRKFSKPSFIEFETYRELEHCGPNNDDDLNYRPVKEQIYWKKKCPLKNIKKKFKTKLEIKKLNKIEKKINNEISAAFRFAKKDKFAKKQILDRFIYAK